MSDETISIEISLSAPGIDTLFRELEPEVYAIIMSEKSRFDKALKLGWSYSMTVPIHPTIYALIQELPYSFTSSLLHGNCWKAAFASSDGTIHLLVPLGDQDQRWLITRPYKNDEPRLDWTDPAVIAKYSQRSDCA